MRFHDPGVIFVRSIFADCGSCSGQINYGTAKAGVTGLSKVIAKEWGPHFSVRANRYALQCPINCPTTLYPTDLWHCSIAFGHILTRLTAAKEEGAFVTMPDGSKVALGIPKAQQDARASTAHMDIPLRRPGTAKEAASVILAVASPLFSYVNGQTIMVSILLVPYTSSKG